MQCTIVDVAAGGDCKFCDYCEVRIIPITVTVTPHYAVGPMYYSVRYARVFTRKCIDVSSQNSVHLLICRPPTKLMIIIGLLD